ncbi:hypothetical protein LGT39_09440 [Demequina sp. TTPB684]|uniref:hypothetical protein n=1 Tax=unclassified Demequina TaxID=2620311 RepID=UPI001CF57D26|nr:MULTISPECIES: hypothetical protein [unclassified Demequina]MCB2413064.1 hypothetical protein [Demequina sp. TTPB684]UPU88128.1 hypothetical protein LGT36_012900 [Demequina sp. TMPB413]
MALWGRKGSGGGRREIRRGKAPLDPFADFRLWAIIGDLLAGKDRLSDVALLVPAERDYVLGIVWKDDSPIPTATVRAWYEAAPSGIRASALGGALVRDAWLVRGRAHAEHTAAANFRGFHALLKEADEFMMWAAQQWPTEPSLWIPLLTSARGLQYPREVLDQRAGTLHRLEPWNFAAAHQYLQFVCAKWFGSHEEMYRVARIFLQAPPGSAVRAMIATAHIERAIAVDERVLPSSLSPAEADELSSELWLMVQSIGPTPTPDQIDALARLVLVLAPTDGPTAGATLRAIEIIDGRCFSFPSGMAEDQLGFFDSILRERGAQARKLGAA